jgi:glycosyltransferase involved in cell wall biosynthesis
MVHPAVRKEVAFHGTYKNFKIVEHPGRFFAIPGNLPEFDARDRRRLNRHPAVLTARTQKDLESLIDKSDLTTFRPEPLGKFENFELFRFSGRIYAIPENLPTLDLSWPEDREREGVLSAETLEAIRDRIRAYRAAVPVEFAGWLPIFKKFGDCGTHPQFAHVNNPPAGYRFVQSVPSAKNPRPQGGYRWFNPLIWVAVLFRSLAALLRPLHAVLINCWLFGPVRCFLVLCTFLRLYWQFIQLGAGIRQAFQFLRSRHFRSQLLLPSNSELVFLTSVPYTYGQKPWIIEIEDTTSLFFPFIENGTTYVGDLRQSPYFPMVKALLESESCRGIVTHIRSTARSLPVLFGSEKIARKTSYVPLGVRLPENWQKQEPGDHVDLLFTNSWHQNPNGFFLRGGLDVLEAFAILKERYPQVRLTMRSSIPGWLDERYYKIIERGWVRVFSHFLPADELDDLQCRSHVYLLPAARVHIVSLLQAMSYGQAVVTSDGWGIQEYVTHGRNGLIVPGRHGKVSWMDEKTGILRENYKLMEEPDPQVVEGLVEAVSRLIEDEALRQTLGQNARADVENVYNLEQWNRGLQMAFDRSRSGT